MKKREKNIARQTVRIKKQKGKDKRSGKYQQKGCCQDMVPPA